MVGSTDLSGSPGNLAVKRRAGPTVETRQTRGGDLALAFAAARVPLGLVVVLVTLAGIGWWWTAGRMQGMGKGPWIGSPGRSAGSWASGEVMMAAMMFPSSRRLRLRCGLADDQTGVTALAGLLFAGELLLAAWAGGGLSRIPRRPGRDSAPGDIRVEPCGTPIGGGPRSVRDERHPRKCSSPRCKKRCHQGPATPDVHHAPFFAPIRRARPTAVAPGLSSSEPSGLRHSLPGGRRPGSVPAPFTIPATNSTNPHDTNGFPALMAGSSCVAGPSITRRGGSETSAVVKGRPQASTRLGTDSGGLGRGRRTSHLLTGRSRPLLPHEFQRRGSAGNSRRGPVEGKPVRAAGARTRDHAGHCRMTHREGQRSLRKRDLMRGHRREGTGELDELRGGLGVVGRRARLGRSRSQEAGIERRR
jgi:hypothetical protein